MRFESFIALRQHEVVRCGCRFGSFAGLWGNFVETQFICNYCDIIQFIYSWLRVSQSRFWTILLCQQTTNRLRIRIAILLQMRIIILLQIKMIFLLQIVIPKGQVLRISDPLILYYINGCITKRGLMIHHSERTEY